MIEKYEKFVEDNWTGHEGPYCAVALAGECGEVMNEIKKEIRDGSDRTDKVKLELGDTLYYLTKLSHDYGFTLTDIMEANIKKLQERHGIVVAL